MKKYLGEIFLSMMVPTPKACLKNPLSKTLSEYLNSEAFVNHFKYITNLFLTTPAIPKKLLK